MAKSIVSDKQARFDRGDGRMEKPFTGTTAQAGILQLDGTAGDIQNTGPQAAGSTGLAADAGHVHFCSGGYLCAPNAYAPSTRTALTVTTTTLAPWLPAATTVASGSNGGEISQVASWSSPSGGVLDVASSAGFPASGTFTVATSSTTATCTYTGTAAGQLTGVTYVSGSATGTVSTGGTVTLVSSAVSTGAFTAPASGSVVVTADFVMNESVNGDSVAFGLAAHGTVTPVIGDVITLTVPQTGNYHYTLVFYVTGLTPGAGYQLDLLGAATSTTTATIEGQGQSSTAIQSAGAPAVMLVQAV
jgi:glycine cleavage system H lipoate-binding protein